MFLQRSGIPRKGLGPQPPVEQGSVRRNTPAAAGESLIRQEERAQKEGEEKSPDQVPGNLQLHQAVCCSNERQHTTALLEEEKSRKIAVSNDVSPLGSELLP